MDLGIEGKVIIVTDGARGTGRDIAMCIAAEGAIVAIAGGPRDDGAKLVARIRGSGWKAHFIEAELEEAGDCQKVVDETLEKYGHIDALVNNTEANVLVSLESDGPGAFCSSLEKNLYHYYYMTHYCLPALKKAGGAIVNISPPGTLSEQGNNPGNTPAAGAQLALTREWAVELLPYQIRVNAIMPLQSPAHSAPNQMAREEIAAMTAYLVSGKASHITGQHICVERGDSISK